MICNGNLLDELLKFGYLGTFGVALALALTQFLYFWPSYYFLVRSQLGPCFKVHLRSMTPAGITSCIMGISVGIMSILNDVLSVLWLSSEIVVGMLIYGSLNWFLYRTDTINMMRLISGKST